MGSQINGSIADGDFDQKLTVTYRERNPGVSFSWGKRRWFAVILRSCETPSITTRTEQSSEFYGVTFGLTRSWSQSVDLDSLVTQLLDRQWKAERGIEGRMSEADVEEWGKSPMMVGLHPSDDRFLDEFDVDVEVWVFPDSVYENTLATPAGEPPNYDWTVSLDDGEETSVETEHGTAIGKHIDTLHFTN